MVKSELSKVMTVLAVAYPRFEVNEGKLNLWFELLQDIPYELCKLGVKKYILENSFPPVIADIRKLVMTLVMSMDNPLDGEEAWDTVLCAINIYSIYKAAEAYKNLSTTIIKVVTKIGWAEICLNYSDCTMKDRFIELYNFEVNMLLKNCLVSIESYKRIYDLSHEMNRSKKTSIISYQ